MSFESPLYEAEFGYPIDLHDGIIKSVDSTETDLGADMIWAIHIFQESLYSKGEERDYLYRLQFKGCRGDIPKDLVGKDIYRDWFLPIDKNSYAVVLILLPCGVLQGFYCNEIAELSLELA